jgi:curved DNA-binding protein CbpA
MESRTSLPPPAADALFRAAREHATGWLTFSSNGAEARLYLQAGDLVGARLGFGYQTLAQALLSAGALDLPTLDALWAKGEAGPTSPALLQAVGSSEAASELQTLASVRRLVSQGGEAIFMPAMVDAVMPRVSGARAVRAAFETLGPLRADAIVCCRDVEECAGWLLEDEERALLERFASFRPAGELRPTEAALLRLLQHDGRVEILDSARWQARSAMEREEEARRSEEEGRRNVARAAIESARNSEEVRRSEQRQRAEQARRALEAARAAEAAWREAQAHLPRRDTPLEEAMADTVVRGPVAADTLSRAVELQALESTDPAFPHPGFEEEVPRLTAAEAIPSSRELEPDTLRQGMVGSEGGQGDTLKPFRPNREEAPPPVRHKTEEPVIIPAPPPVGGATAPVSGAPRRRDTLPTFASLDSPPVLSEAAVLPESERRPPGSTPIWGSEGDDQAASETLLQSAERVEVVPMPSPADGTTPSAEPILLFADADLPVAAPGPAELVEEMTEALRRAGASVPAETWLAATDGAVSAAPAAPSPSAAVGIRTPQAFRTPLRLGPAEPTPEEDLWRLVKDPSAPPPAAAAPASFEEALATVDAHLSSLVGLADEAGAQAGPATDALQAPADAGPWQMETLPPVVDSPEPPQSPLETTPAVTPSGGGVPGEAARERRQRLLRRAIQNLGSLVSRPARTMGSATPLEPTPAPVPATARPRSPAEQAFARQVEERFAGLAGERNRFDILGLHLEASREQVKTAFLDLVKVFHPDRLPPALAELVPQATAIFDSLREAHDYLQDDERRAFHAKEMSALASGRPLRDQAEAAEAYRAGEVALRRRDHAAAEAHFAEAYRLYPRATVLAAQAWAIYMDPNRKSDAASARAMMVDALKEDPSCDRAHYQLGVIARVEGDVERAERHFREALKANPRHLEASQELRLIEMRKRGGPVRKPR